MKKFFLDKYRKSIDKIDRKLVKLLSKRGLVAIKIAKLKNSSGEQVYDYNREKELLDKIYKLNLGPFDNNAFSCIYSEILRQSKVLQDKNIDNTAYKPNLKSISVQGIKGSFSEQVAINYCNEKCLVNYEIDYSVSSENVVANVLNNKSAFGIVALCNNWGGVVDETVEALKNKPYHILDTYKLMVKQNLLILPDVKRSEITDIFSHQQALAQCRVYIQENFPDATLHEVDDTAKAAESLQQGLYSRTAAVIASKSCALHYGLKMLGEKIQDSNCNETLFLIIAKK